MTTPASVFWQRVRQEWKMQYRVWRLAVDWIVALYIVLPFLGFAGYNYAMWWKQAPEWIGHIPYYLVAAMLVAAAVLTASVRWFVRAADALFLTQRGDWTTALKRRGIAYSLAMNAAAVVLLLIAASPLLVNGYSMHAADLIRWGAILIAAQAQQSFLLAWVRLRTSGLTRALARIVFSAIGASVYVWLLARAPESIGWTGAAVLAAASAAWARGRMRWKGTFDQDVEYERQRTLRFASLMVGRFTDKKPRTSRKTPYVFSRSQPIFRKRTSSNVLAELTVKSFFRKWSSLQLYLQFTGVGAAAVALVPVLWIKLTVWGALGLLIGYWMKRIWNDAQASDFVNMFALGDAVKLEAAPKALFVLMMPAFTLLTLILGVTAHASLGVAPMLQLPLGIVLSIPVGISVSRLVASIMTLW